MATIRAYTTIEQSRKLAEILPLKSADMTLPFTYSKNKYIPGYVVSRNYVEIYNEMIKLPAMEKEDVCKLIQPVWSLAALLGVLPPIEGFRPIIDLDINLIRYEGNYRDELCFNGNNLIDACVTMIEKLHELKML